MMRTALLAAVLAFALHGSLAAAADTVKLGFSPQSWELKAYVQPRYELNYLDGDNTTSTFLIRRGRIYVTGDLMENLRARFQLSATPTRTEILDVYFAWTLPMSEKRVLTLTGGQFKRPFSYQEFVMTSSNLNLIERSRVNLFMERTLRVSSRDQGAMATVDLWEVDLPVALYAGVFNGTQLNTTADTDRTKQFVGRVETVPLRGITLGADISSNWLTGDTDTLGTESTESFIVWGLEGSWVSGGAQVLAEYFSGDNYSSAFAAGALLPSDPVDFTGWYAEAIYRFKSGWEPAVRFDFLDTNRDTEDDAERIVTGQLAHSFNPNFRWQLNVVVRDFEDPDTDSATEVVNQITVRL